LMKGKDLFTSGERKASILLKTVKESIESVDGVALQYVEIRDIETFQKIENVNRPSVMAVAAVVGKTRLIDNMIIGRSEKG
jgi:pantoate--beta-alanine ligase